MPGTSLCSTYKYICSNAVITLNITKTCLYNFDPFKPHFYIVKLGFTGVYIIFLISVKNIECGYSLEPPHRGSSNEYPQSMFWTEIWKISEFFICNFSFLMVNFSIYLNRHVFVMILGQTGLGIFADPDQMPYNVTSDQGLHCLPLIQHYFRQINR